MTYCRQLDGLRGFAVLAVILFHCDRTFPGGFIGVDLFFVLSGFLITGVLARDPGLARFYWRRLWRLIPALLLFLAAYLATAPMIWPGHPHGRDALLTGFYVSNYSFALTETPLYLQHTWSLAVEEQFYLLWPFAVPLLLKARSPVAWLGAAIVALTLWRLGEPAHQQYYYRFDTRATGLLVGALLFFTIDRVKLTNFRAYAAVALLVLVSLAGQFLHAKPFITAAEIGAFFLVGCAATGRLGALNPMFSSAPMVYLGRWSYALYLWHFPIALAVRDHFSALATVAIVVAISVPCAALSYVTVEAWGRSLRDRVEVRRRAHA